MFAWFLALSLPLQITLGVIGIIAVVIIAYFGRFNIVMGGPKISFGRSRKRNCGDCVLMMLNKRERHESQRERISRNILKDQMNVAEQKLLLVQSILLASYRDELRKRRGSNPDFNQENKEYRLYQGVLLNALMSVKDEIRRSFKENGFVDLKGTDFSLYVKDKVSTLTAIGRDHVLDLYPYNGMIIEIEDRLQHLESIGPKIEDLCFELFQKAKDIDKDALNQIDQLDKEFSDELNEFIGVSNETI